MGLPEAALGGLAVLLATSAGAAVVLFLGKIGKGGYTAMLAFSAGAMAYSSIEMLEESRKAGDAGMFAGFAAGLLVLMAIEKALPHIHRHVRNTELGRPERKAALIAGSIAIHNVPEGLAVATAFASGTPLGWFVTTAIALQDIPEGALVSAPLAAYGIGSRQAALFGVLSGAVEAVAAAAGFVLLSAFASLVPLSLAFSGGAMAYVIFVELLPDAMADGMERTAAATFVCGAAAAYAIAGLLAV